jgi:CDP-diacylglycerol--serine O-phosphatidyltransferase
LDFFSIFTKKLFMSIAKYIPNTFTLANLFSGCLGVLFAVNDRMEYAALFVALGIFCDFFDGFFARKFNVASDVGLQLDSLADMVTSGLVPGIVMYQLLNQASGLPWGEEQLSYAPSFRWFGLAITLASAYRLAKFNVDERQTSSFIGLPTPANAIFILSIPLILIFEEYAFAKALFSNPYVLLAITALSCFLLNAELPLFALKFKNFSWKDNIKRYVFLVLCIILLITLKYLAIPLIIMGYILMSLLWKD